MIVVWHWLLPYIWRWRTPLLNKPKTLYATCKQKCHPSYFGLSLVLYVDLVSVVWLILYYLSHGLKLHTRIFLTFHQAQVWADVRGSEVTRYAESRQCMAMLANSCLENSNPRLYPWSWWLAGFSSSLPCPHFRAEVSSLRYSISFYEGHSMQSITFPVRLMKRLGVDIMIGKALHAVMSVYIDILSKLLMQLVA